MSRITSSSQPFEPNFFKKPSAVLVTFALCDGVFNTLEGKVLYAAADALMTGVLGEHWPIRRQTFESSYEACDSQPMGVDGYYRKRPIPVFARQLTHSCVITLDETRGELNGKPSDWILKDASGRSWVVANDVFQITYAALQVPLV